MVRKHGKQRGEGSGLKQVFDESSEEESVAARSPTRASTKGTKKNQNQPSTSRQNNKTNQSRQQQASTSAARNERQPAQSQQQQQQQEREGGNRRKNQFPKHIREIMKLQQSTENLIPKAPFTRFMREILQRHGNYRMQSTAILAVQEATEVYLVGLFDDAYKLTLHRKRVTLIPADLALVLYIRGQSDPGTR